MHGELDKVESNHKKIKTKLLSNMKLDGSWLGL